MNMSWHRSIDFVIDPLCVMTSSNGHFSALLAICAGNSPVPDEFLAQRPVTRSFDVFFDLRLNKRLSKQSWGWWSETPPRSLWRQCNGGDPMFTYLFHFHQHLFTHNNSSFKGYFTRDPAVYSNSTYAVTKIFQSKQHKSYQLLYQIYRG